jgi:lysophospholipase L1-like esterase
MQARLPSYLAFVVVLTGFSFGEVNVDADDPNIQYSGRIDFSDSKAVRFEWTGVYIRARFSGTTLGVRLDDGNGNYNVFIDGALDTIFVTKGGMFGVSEYMVQGLSAGEHTVLLTRRNEGYSGPATFRGFILDDGAGLLALADKPERKIQFIGDSYSAGLNNESDGSECDTRAMSNSYVAFPALTGRALDAEYHVLAKSGAGVVRNYGSPTTVDPNAYPSRYARLFPSVSSSVWDSTSWVPDVVVICLGLNDFTSDPKPTAAQWKDSLRVLIGRVRTACPGAEILCVGELFNPQVTQTRLAVQEEESEGHTDIHYCLLPHVSGGGVCGHPNLETHQQYANIITAAIQGITGWQGTPVVEHTPSPVDHHGVAGSVAATYHVITPSGVRIENRNLHAVYDLRGRLLRAGTPRPVRRGLVR